MKGEVMEGLFLASFEVPFLSLSPPIPLSIFLIQMAFSKCTCAYYLDELHLPYSEV